MAESGRAGDREADKAARQATRELIAAYHQAELRALLEHVRTGFDQLDAGTIDEFELDDLIHHYKRAANELWKFCGSSGGQWLHAANALAYRREQGDEPDRGRSAPPAARDHDALSRPSTDPRGRAAISANQRRQPPTDGLSRLRRGIR